MANRPLLKASLLALVATALLPGCSNLSGVGGTSEYSCKAQPGVHCESISGIYQNAIHNNLPGQRSSPTAARPAAPEPEPEPRGDARAQLVALAQPLASSPAPGAPYQGGPQPLRSSARILRLWFKPWEDADHDLFDQGYLYVQVDGGRWMLDHVQRRAREGFPSVRPPRPVQSSAAPDTSTDSSEPLPSRPRLPSPEVGQTDALERLSALRGANASPAADNDDEGERK